MDASFWHDEEVGLGRFCSSRQHDLASRNQRCIVADASPQHDAIVEHSLFADRFLVFSVSRLKQPLRPRMSTVPIEGAPRREELICCIRVCTVPNEIVDPIDHQWRFWSPTVSDSSSAQKVTPMIMVVVVIRIPKVGHLVSIHTLTCHDPVPSFVVHERVTRSALGENLQCRDEPARSVISDSRQVQSIRNQNLLCKSKERLACKII
mmetsp:Transcript_34328/g.91787  ORF Transcript_34328/g.91787 Transcript_34328/m.91787 type:complete len:207 (+) Transcript_34328:1378-1998(+)